MRGWKAYGVAVLLAALMVGCDSGSDDDLSETELFVGTWTVASVRDDEGDKTPVVNALGTMSATFESGGAFELTFDAAQQGVPDQTASGTYTVNEALNVIMLNATVQGTTFPVPVEFTFEGEDRVTLSIPELAVDVVASQIAAFGALEGEVSLTLARD